MRTLAKGAGPCSWRIEQWKDEAKTITIVIRCPSCGRDSVLSRKVHLVGRNGVVGPSYVCPQSNCTFHEFIQLDQWKLPDPRSR